MSPARAPTLRAEAAKAAEHLVPIDDYRGDPS
mgnify:CR=1 FL=1